MDVSRDILVAPAGSFTQSTGWPLFFLISIVAAVSGLMLLPLFAPWNPKPVTATRPGFEEEEDIWGTK